MQKHCTVSRTKQACFYNLRALSLTQFHVVFILGINQKLSLLIRKPMYIRTRIFFYYQIKRGVGHSVQVSPVAFEA